MNIEKRWLRSHEVLMPLDNQTSTMQNNLFNKKTAPLSPLPELLLSKDTPLLTPFNQDDYSENQLNMGFIAEDSKLLLSDSQSVISDGYSISAISVIRANSKLNSPHFLRFEQEISGMDEWSQHTISFNKQNFKRPNPSIEEEDFEQQVGNRCTKKKMNDRMKVVTINQTTKKQKTNEGGYMLRSKVKAMAVCEQDSSDDVILQMINEIDDNKKIEVQVKSKSSIK